MIIKKFYELKAKRLLTTLKRSIGDNNSFYPNQLAIEFYRGCNAHCIMCPSDTMKRKKGAMDVNTHKIIIDKIKDWGAPIDLITHAGLGEPLLDKGMEKKIEYEKKVFPDAQIVLYSNGGLLNEQRIYNILNSGIDVISFSVNGFNKDTYEKVMKIPRDKTYDNINLLLQIREKIKKDVKVQVSIIPTEFISSEEIQLFKRYWVDKVDAVVIPPWISWGDYLNNNTLKKQLPCFYIWKVLMIDVDGTVKMCCEDFDSKYPMGNILNQKLDEIFNSIRMQKQRNNQLCGNFKWPEICNNCIETHEVAFEFWKSKPILINKE